MLRLAGALKVSEGQVNIFLNNIYCAQKVHTILSMLREYDIYTFLSGSNNHCFLLIAATGLYHIQYIKTFLDLRNRTAKSLSVKNDPVTPGSIRELSELYVILKICV